MGYKERVVTTNGYSRLQTEATDGINMAIDLVAEKIIAGEEPRTLIPFCSVDRVIKTTTMEDREDKNPYGCTAQGGGGDAVVDSAEVCLNCVGQ